MRLFVDISWFSFAEFRAEIHRAAREVLFRLLNEKNLSLALLVFDGNTASFWKVDPDTVRDRLVSPPWKIDDSARLERVDIDVFKPGDLFFDIDATWVVTWRRSDLYPLLKKQGVTIVSYVYDINYYAKPTLFNLGYVTNFLYYIGSVLQYADVVMAPTKSTLAELDELRKKLNLRKVPEYSTWLGSDFRPGPQGMAANPPHPEALAATAGRYVLMAGSIQPLRNHGLVLDAFDNGLFQKGLNLVIAGKASSKTEEIQQRIRRHSLFGRQLFLIERTDAATINCLYDKAFCVAFAPLREGFGFPVIEAFQHGVPVLASDIPILREVGGEFCRYFDPQSATSFINAVLPLLESEDEYSAWRHTISTYRLVTWDEVSGKIAEILRKHASTSFVRRFIAGLMAGKTDKRQSDTPSEVDSVQFADQNLGAPVRCFLPCHNGISVDMNENVWTNGKVATIRVKIRGSFRRGLCLVLDFSTFNGRKKATIYANETQIGSIDACGLSRRIMSIPATCIGEDRTISIRMDLPDAISPDEVVHNGDKRLLSLKLLDMRFFDEDGYFACHCGESLYFAEDEGALGAQYCIEGVSRPEKMFTWTNGNRFSMRFSPFEGMPRSLTLHYRTYLPEERVTLYVNNVEISSYIASGEEKKTFDIPQECGSADGVVILSMLLPDAVSPKEQNEGADSRRLALRLYSVRLDNEVNA